MQAPCATPVALFGATRVQSFAYACGMTKKGKQSKHPEKRPPRISPVIAANLQKLFAFAAEREEYADRQLPSLLSAYIKEQKWEDTLSTTHIYRIEKGKSSVGADVVDLIARAFGFEAWQLLLDTFDPENPPVARTPQAQREFEKRMRLARSIIEKGNLGLENQSVGAGRVSDNESSGTSDRDVEAATDDKVRPAGRRQKTTKET